MEILISREAGTLRQRWPILEFLGIACVILGTIAISVSFAATLATVFFLGCLVSAGGVVHLIQTFSTRGWVGVFGHVLATILYIVAGVYMMVNPEISAASLTLVIGMLLVVGGAYQLVTSLAMRHAGWGWTFLHGLVSVVLGALIFQQWPVTGLWVIGAFVGIDLIFRGWAAFMLALSVRAAGTPRLETIRRGIDERRGGLQDRRAAA